MERPYWCLTADEMTAWDTAMRRAEERSEMDTDTCYECGIPRAEHEDDDFVEWPKPARDDTIAGTVIPAGVAAELRAWADAEIAEHRAGAWYQGRRAAAREVLSILAARLDGTE